MDGALTLALALGFLLGVKHATEADHLVAITTIVSEQRSIWRSGLVGVLWGVGHTASLLAVGVVVILLEIRIPVSIAEILEFLVALMIIFLGGRILYLTLRYRQKMHLHTHAHNGRVHTHFHLHEESGAQPPNHGVEHRHSVEHHGRSLSGWRPLVVGVVHGLAGSAVLTLLVLTEVVRAGSRFRGLAYLFAFGIGSIGGMLLMSVIISLPIVLATRRFERMEVPMRLVVSIASMAFGFYYAWITGRGL